jgi:hypothetical protein
MMAEEGGGIQMSNLSTAGKRPPAWVKDVDTVEQCLSDIQNLQEQLLHMHAQRVGSVFGKDLADMEENIEAMTAQVTDKFRYAERLLQKVGVATRRAGGQEATVGANVQRRYVV